MNKDDKIRGRAAMKRVMIYGGSGSGKSTLARKIGEISGLPVVHIDPMYYRKGWVQRPKSETTQLVLAATATEKWVFDGNHHCTFDARIAGADMVIFLDFPTWLRLWRVVLRTLRFRGKTRPDMTPGCPERFNREFIIKWVAGYYWRSHAIDLAIYNDIPAEKQRFRLKSARQVRAFLNAL